jgi:hypothetical protein
VKRISVVGLIVMALTITAVPALAAGVSATPGTIDVDDALRGSTIFRQIFLYNDTGVETPFEIYFEGEAGPWMSAVDPEDRTTPVTQALDPDGSGVSVLVRIDIPSDTTNGVHEGVLVARLGAAETDDGVGVALGIKMFVTLDVSGDQVIAAELQDVSLADTEVGVPARVVAAIENQGNTQVTPEFKLDILSNGSVVSSTTTASVPSFPGEQKSFDIRWDTTGAVPGEYTARLAVDFAGIDLGTHERTFTVHDAGSLNRLLVLSGLEVTGEPRAGGLTGFTALVQNPGQVDVAGRLVGELTLNGVFLSIYESPQFLVQAEEVLSLPINVETPEAGEYTLTIRAEYGDEQTEPMSVTVAVETGSGATSDGGTDSSFPIAAVIAIVVIALIAIAIGAWLVASRKRKNGTQPATTPEDTEKASVGSDT